MTAILGISAFYHDSAAALVVDGQVVAAAQEERFTRSKHDSGFPAHAIEYCLQAAGLNPGQLDYVGFYDKPLLKFERLLETYLSFAPSGFRSFLKAMPVWLKQKLHLRRELNRGLNGAYSKQYVFTEHHESHAASAFYPSPFEEAAILTADGVGEWATSSYGVGQGNRITLTHEMHFPHSLGMLYSAFTYFCGFTVNSGEYKLMGLAPYGQPKYVDLILDRLVDLKEDGSFRMDMSYFNYCQGLTMTSSKFDRLFGGVRRTPEAPVTEREMDMAASVQKVTEEVMLKMARHVHAQTGQRKLCLAGGVALNCVANGRILREGPFEDIWIQPAAGDAGGALGVALFIWHQLLDRQRHPQPSDSQHASLLGPAYSSQEIEALLDEADVEYEEAPSEEELCERVADAIAEGQVVGWFQGRMEFGPRALGSRSILGDARQPAMQSVINQKVKFREGFRPFAPLVLADQASDFFEIAPQHQSPYMLLVAPVNEDKRLPTPEDLQDAHGLDRLAVKRSVVPAITHIDYSARMQTVDPVRHALLHRLLSRFHDKTGCPIMVNTSFNLGWDPIVCTPRDAYATFMSCDVDLLVMDRFLVSKQRQPASVVVSADNATNDPVLDERIKSPCCGSTLHRDAGQLVCEACRHSFEDSQGIARLYWPHESIDDPADVTERVKAFYEETPFPNYDDHDSVRSLIEKSRRGRYARRLDESIPYNSTVLEVGCGTGQLTNFLGIGCRHVIGTDMCLNSLKLGEAFRREHDLSRVRFVQMNLFRPALREAQFDVVLCNGVLHHTADPYGGFQGLLPLLKPGGVIVVGLYNTYGRLLTDLRRNVFRLTGGTARWIDPILRESNFSEDKRRAWFADQYRHPHESKHTFGEVLGWFDATGLEFIRGIPALRAQDDGLAGSNLFENQPRGTALDHFAVQAMEIFGAGQKQGGFFIMVGQKPAQSTATDSDSRETHSPTLVHPQVGGS